MSDASAAMANSPGARRTGYSPGRLLRTYHFQVGSLVLLTLTIVAFSDNLFTDVGQPSNSDPKFIAHGLFCLAWMVLLTAQAGFVRARRLSWHRTLGWTALAVAVGVAASTLWVFIAIWKGWAGMSAEAQANRFLLPGFVVAVALGFLRRRRADQHKRLLYVATLFMLGPVIARTYDPLVVPLLPDSSEVQIEALFLPYFGALWAAFFAALIAYDLAILRRIHLVTLAGALWVIMAWAIALIL